ncbi:MAG: hypothetical protein COV52_01040 [Gammaproteobacteria bacterium CG11_big_fil_rev_8_21_14_0_20_46_22]|nr:MAG: hypothetical protein COW05_03330 [Gammaproteobacteria bacterium CG12_big_fil_rev_8_21_14_0_65_46_12]PIR12003.1 MAG: hypothetical protein COV52_01040 [Gammaproteobacteria bacterium CG11_big_fil_rev_8_21_14_0_20_46_22]
MSLSLEHAGQHFYAEHFTFQGYQTLNHGFSFTLVLSIPTQHFQAHQPISIKHKHQSCSLTGFVRDVMIQPERRTLCTQLIITPALMLEPNTLYRQIIEASTLQQALSLVAPKEADQITQGDLRDNFHTQIDINPLAFFQRITQKSGYHFFYTHTDNRPTLNAKKQSDHWPTQNLSLTPTGCQLALKQARNKHTPSPCPQGIRHTEKYYFSSFDLRAHPGLCFTHEQKTLVITHIHYQSLDTLGIKTEITACPLNDLQHGETQASTLSQATLGKIVAVHHNTVEMIFEWDTRKTRRPVPIAMPVSGHQQGFYSQPAANRIGIVNCLHNDPDQPYLIGCIDEESQALKEQACFKLCNADASNTLKLTEDTLLIASTHNINTQTQTYTLEAENNLTINTQSALALNGKTITLIADEEIDVNIAGTRLHITPNKINFKSSSIEFKT